MKQVNSFSLAKLGEPLSEEETYQHKLRNAMYGGVSEIDVQDIVKGVVKRAKDGDEKSVRLVFDYFLGGRGVKQATQINVFPPEKPASEPTKALRGTKAKIEAMAERAKRGERLDHPQDYDPE